MPIGIVIPAYNEEERLLSALRVLRRDLKNIDYEIVVVDDGSTDGTAEVAKSSGVRLVRLYRNRGKGAAVREGILEALRAGCGPLLFTDCDLACPPGEWGKLLGALEREADTAIASRHLRGSRVAGRIVWRTLSSHGFAFLARLVTGLPYRDFQCGCKAFSRDAALSLFSEPFLCERYAFDVEVLLRASALGLRVAEVPVAWCEKQGSKVRLLKHGAEMVKSLFVLQADYGKGGRRCASGYSPWGRHSSVPWDKC